MHRNLLRLSAVALALTPTFAMAHTGLGPHSDVMHGFMHPLSGLDHVLAMVAVGLFAARLGGRALILVPAAFVLTMAAAGVVGMTGVGLPFVEIGIGLSVVVLGAAIACRLDLPVAAAMALVGFFAVFHGHVHGAEMPASMSGLAFGAGFAGATALLHAAGIGLVVGSAGTAHVARALQLGGSAVALAGIAILAGVI